MHYPLTDIQVDFEINRPVRYRNTAKGNYFHRRGQTSRTTTIGSLKKRNTIKIQQHLYRPISQTVFMLSIEINRAEHVCATVIIKHNYMLMCNHKIVINILLCL